MASPFWTYVFDKLRWGLIDKPGPVQAVVKGVAHRFDEVRDDAVFMRAQWFPQLCEPELVPEHGYSRGVIRHHTETPEQYRRRVINAYAWHLLGGKQEGLPEILRFYGFDIAELESLRKYQSSRWAEFQVGLHNPNSLEEQNAILESLETFVWLINEYKPARSILARLYTDIYNITPLIWSEGRYSEHFYSHFSGVPASDLGGDWKDEGLILSFGQRLGIVIPGREDYGAPIFSGLGQMGFIAPYIDSPVWSQFNYSDDFPPKHGFTIGELFSFDWCVRTTTSYEWDNGEWDDRHWEEYSEWDRILPKWSIRYRDFARSQLVYGDDLITSQAGLWGGLNACYGIPTAVVIGNPPVWGEFAYSDDFDRQEVQILEQRLDRRGMTTGPVNIQDPHTYTQGIISMHTPELDDSWSGGWDDRRWYDHIAHFCITSHTKETE